MLKMELFDCAINEKCCSVNSLREISNLVEFTGPRYSHGT